MAFKFAFIAALCIAQAFAFLPFDDEKVTNYDIFVSCWDNQREILDIMGEKMSMVGTNVLDYLRGEKREQARKYVMELEGSVAKINATTFELHNNVLTNLKDKKIPEAAESLVAGIKDIAGIFGSIHERVQQIIEEVPELSDTMKWMYRYLVFTTKIFFPNMRKSYGKCLMVGKSNNEF